MSNEIKLTEEERLALREVTEASASISACGHAGKIEYAVRVLARRVLAAQPPEDARPTMKRLIVIANALSSTCLSGDLEARLDRQATRDMGVVQEILAALESFMKRTRGGNDYFAAAIALAESLLKLVRDPTWKDRRWGMNDDFPRALARLIDCATAVRRQSEVMAKTCDAQFLKMGKLLEAIRCAADTGKPVEIAAVMVAIEDGDRPTAEIRILQAACKEYDAAVEATHAFYEKH